MKETIRIQARGKEAENSLALHSEVPAGGRNLLQDSPPLPPWKIWKVVSTAWLGLW